MKALLFSQFGTPGVLYYGELPSPVPGDNEILVRTKAIGLNYADVYRRKGNYHLQGNPPFILGYEGAGVVEAVGRNITDIQPGDRIGFADVPFANAELVVVPYEKAIPLPEHISFETAAASLLQGLTAQYLTRNSYAVKPGDTVLVHAAAGGVGQLLVQICKQLGASVIGLTSGEEKKAAVLNAGADAVFLYSNWKEAVLEQTKNTGVDVVFESIGSTIMDSFAATKIRGTVVFYGFAGGNPPAVDPRMLMDKSQTLTGGDLWNYLTSREERIQRSEELFDWIEKGVVTVHIGGKFSLADGKKAHELIESRKSTGKIILIP
jgi:NADPH:quinone reductase